MVNFELEPRVSYYAYYFHQWKNIFELQNEISKHKISHFCGEVIYS